MPRALSHFPAKPHACCQPGDLAVAKVEESYRIARVIAAGGPGPSWEHVATFTEFEAAIRHALELARANGKRAWIPTSAGLCEPIPSNLLP
ncbi:MAG TPA: hypothetical protein VFO19_23315 [Vicinamibacterales bacterium]|nr:hypothetical protein [Vicinamibacterales bacterium]